MSETLVPVVDGNGSLIDILHEQETAGLALRRTIAPGSNVVAGLVETHATVAVGSFSRPANVTPYAAGQLVANAVLPASVAPVALAVARFNGGSGLITAIRLAKSTPGLDKAAFRVHLYDAAPTPAYGDGGLYQTDRATSYLGHLDLTMDAAFTDGAAGLYAAADQPVLFVTAAGSSSIYALIEARDAYTPGSSETFTLSIDTIQN